jgi:aminoglycoside phosphotransferase (APT) family kinase protein
MTVSATRREGGPIVEEAELRAALGNFIGAKLGVTGLEVVAFRRHVEGFSWETYEIVAHWTARGAEQQRAFIVHRAPAAGLLEPYSARPVFELRKAVEAIDGVPVPVSLWLDEKGDATGRPLYVVEHVDGQVPTQWTSDTFFKSDDERRSTARQLMRIGAALHAAPVDIAPDGLRGSGPDPYEIVRCWHEIYTRDCLEPVPPLDYGFAWLAANRHRISRRRSVLHGDFRTGNYMIRDGQIVALLDFEEGHVGDPVQDLAHCALRLFRGRTRQPSGLVPLAEMLEMYEEASGWKVPHDAFHFWSVFEAVYSAVTQHRAASLFARGRTDDVRYPALGYQAHHVHRYVIDYVEAAESGGSPK